MKSSLVIPTLTALFVVAAVLGPWALDTGLLRLLTEILLVLTMAQLWNLLAGYTGLLSMGHQMFFGIGAYAVFFASNNTGVSALYLLPVGAVCAAILAVLISGPLFRLRDAYFAVSSWVVAEVVYLITASTDAVGASGGYPLETLASLDLDLLSNVAFWLAAAMVLATTGGLYITLRSKFGLGLLCVRDNEIAASAIGVSIYRNRLVAFVVSAAGCGLAGAIYFLLNLYVDPVAAFDPNWTVAILFIVIIGGIGTIEGPFVGAVIYYALREMFGSYFALAGGWYLVAVGTLAIVVMLVAPRGLWVLMRDSLGLQGFDIQRRPPVAAG